MKTRVPWILVVLAAVVVGAGLWLREKPVRPTTPPPVAEPNEPSAGSFSPAKVDFRVPLPKPNLLEIQDGKTIDFSSGLPIIKDSEKEKAALARALKEMEEAAASVSFGAPETPAPAPKSGAP